MQSFNLHYLTQYNVKIRKRFNAQLTSKKIKHYFKLKKLNNIIHYRLHLTKKSCVSLLLIKTLTF